MTMTQSGTVGARPDIRTLTKSSESSAVSADRNLQDQVIRYLADATVRSLEVSPGFLDDKETSRAERFSRFLARRYYRDRLSRGFRYSDKLVSVKTVTHVVDEPEFESILGRCVLGSLKTATEVGNLVVSRLSSLRNERWWHELLEYERAFFLQLATSEQTAANELPQKNASAVIREFHVPISELLARLRSGERVGDDLHGNATLLFSRTLHGKIYVVEVDERTSAVFRTIDGKRSQDEIATFCRGSREEIERVFATLCDIGSVVPPTGQV